MSKSKKKKREKVYRCVRIISSKKPTNLDPLNKGFKDADRNLMVRIPAIFMDGVDTKWNIPKHAITKGSILI